jgi:hypothetical protein
MDAAKRIPLETLDKIVADLIAAPAMHFSESARVPDSAGLYAFFTEQGCLYGGRSNTSLRRRIHVDHWNGGGVGAKSDLIQMVQDHKCADGRIAAQKWMETNCVFRYIEVPDKETRRHGENRLKSHFQPIWCLD